METKSNKKWTELLPPWAIIPLLSILLVNSIVYWGSAVLTANMHHYDFTMAADRMVPLMPGFAWIYVLAFPFWAVNYCMAAWRGKEAFWRFVAADLTIHMACFVIFLVLPTTNIRPVLEGNGISEKLLGFIYAMDGENSPSNLFPSIHCYVSWLCVYAVKGQERVPKWYQKFSVVFAVLIIISTQVLKQHYWVDAAAGVLLVEIFWRFYQKGSRYVVFEKFLKDVTSI